MNAPIEVTSHDLEINRLLRDAIADLLIKEVSKAVGNVYSELDLEGAWSQHFLREDELIEFEVTMGKNVEISEGEVTDMSSFVADFPRKAALIIRAMERRVASEDYGRVLLRGREFRFHLSSVQVRPGMHFSHGGDFATARMDIFVRVHLHLLDVTEDR